MPVSNGVYVHMPYRGWTDNLLKNSSLPELALKAAAKVLSHSVVVSVTLAGHALTNAEIRESFAKSGSGILYSTVGVEDKSRFWHSAAQGHVESRES